MPLIALPFFSNKYNYPRHPNYKLTGDADDKLLYQFRDGGQQHITYEIEGYEEPIEIDMPDDDYTLDDLFVALDYTIIHEMWEEPLDRVAVLTLAREGDLPQIPFLVLGSYSLTLYLMS